MKDLKHPLRVYIVLVIGVLASSSAAIFIRLAQSEDVPSLILAGGRVTLATLVLFPFVVFRPAHVAQIQQLSRRDLAFIGASGLFLAVHFATWISSLEYTTVLISVVLVSTSPIWVATLEMVFLKVRLSQMVILGLVLVVCGGMLIGLSGGNTDSVTTSRPVLGASLAITGAIAVAIYMVIGRKVRASLATTPYVFMVYGVAAVTLLAIILISGTPITGYSTEGYLLIVGLALFPQLTGHSSANFLLAYLPATYVSLAWQTEPILSAFGAFVVFTEVPGPLQILGGGVIVVGVILATLNDRELVMRLLKKNVFLTHSGYRR
jgi:drug/metabolite transporter (DMT)-like permease